MIIKIVLLAVVVIACFVVLLAIVSLVINYIEKVKDDREYKGKVCGRLGRFVERYFLC